MEKNAKYWKALNKANSLLFFILIVGAITLGFVLTIAIFWGSTSRDRPELAIEAVDQSSDPNDEWFLGNSVRIHETDYLRLPLRSKTASQGRGIASGSYSSGSYSDARNYLFVNSTNSSSRWLFPSNDQLILSTIELTPSDADSPVGVLYIVVRKDTDQDLELDIDDDKEIGYSNVGGDEYSSLTEDIDSFHGAHMTSENKVIFFFQKDGKGYVAQFLTTSLDQIRINPLPVIK